MDWKKIIKFLLVIVIISVVFFLVSSSADKTAEAPASLEAEVTDESRETNYEITGDLTTTDIGFEHTQPGSQSEVIYTVGKLKPGTKLEAWLSGTDEEELEVTADEFGVARFVWKITEFGTYTAIDENGSSETVVVEQ